jgi:hypothetical protein
VRGVARFARRRSGVIRDVKDVGELSNDHHREDVPARVPEVAARVAAH